MLKNWLRKWMKHYFKFLNTLNSEYVFQKKPYEDNVRSAGFSLL